MIRNTLIAFVLIVLGFYSLGIAKKLPYNKAGSSFYLVKSETYAYSDTFMPNSITLVGTSLSTYLNFHHQQYPHFYNLALAGRSTLEALNVIIGSDNLPGVVMVEATLFDNSFDSTMTDKMFYKGIGELKHHVFFLQKQHKLHNLLPESVFKLNKRIMGKLFQSTKLYSESINKSQKTHGAPNVLIMEDFVRRRNLYNQTLWNGNTKRDVDQRMDIFMQQLLYLKSRGVKVFMYSTPMVSVIYNSDRQKYRDSLLHSFAIKSNIPYIKIDDVESYQYALVEGDGVHLHREDAKQRFNKLLSDSLDSFLKQ